MHRSSCIPTTYAGVLYRSRRNVSTAMVRSLSVSKARAHRPFVSLSGHAGPSLRLERPLPSHATHALRQAEKCIDKHVRIS